MNLPAFRSQNGACAPKVMCTDFWANAYEGNEVIKKDPNTIQRFKINKVWRS